MNPLTITLPADDFKVLNIPGVDGARLGVCYVRATDIPADLDRFMEINPRVPSRSKKGVLSGPVVKGILETLTDVPEQMVLKNQGIYLLVNDAAFDRAKAQLTLQFTDVGKHGIINGGHTYAAIREAIETSEDKEALKSAFVRLHVFQGIDEDYVPEIAEGLNRSRQVDDPSLVNLQGEFDVIRRVLKDVPGADQIAYHQGDSGPIYISEVLVLLELFNIERFSEQKHPNVLYNRQALGLKYFTEDLQHRRAQTLQLINKLPDILWLADKVRKLTPVAAKHNNFQFGRAKIGDTRAGAAANKGITLPFSGEKVDYRVPNGWVYPMLASFRANLRWDGKTYRWKMPLETLLHSTIDGLVGVCVREHRENNQRPDILGKRESAWAQCFTKMQLFLARKGLL